MVEDGAGAGTVPAQPDLVVLVRQGCPSSALSRRLLDLVIALRPQARSEVLDVDEADALPVPLIATPMWVTGTRLRWLGTPDLDDVLCLLDGLNGDTDHPQDVGPHASSRASRSWWSENWEEVG